VVRIEAVRRPAPGGRALPRPRRRGQSLRRGGRRLGRAPPVPGCVVRPRHVRPVVPLHARSGGSRRRDGSRAATGRQRARVVGARVRVRPAALRGALHGASAARALRRLGRRSSPRGRRSRRLLDGADRFARERPRAADHIAAARTAASARVHGVVRGRELGRARAFPARAARRLVRAAHEPDAHRANAHCLIVRRSRS